MSVQDPSNGVDKESPLTNQHIEYPEESTLRVHFYPLDKRSPWWLRWFWKPNPLYGHCSVQWGSFVHNMSLTDGVGFHKADEWHRENPPVLTLAVPVAVSFERAQYLVRWYTDKRVQKWKSFLWWSHLYRPAWKTPCNCTGLVLAWLGRGDWYRHTGTPDELLQRLREE